MPNNTLSKLGTIEVASSFRLKCFLNDGAPSPEIVRICYWGGAGCMIFVVYLGHGSFHPVRL